VSLACITCDCDDAGDTTRESCLHHMWLRRSTTVGTVHIADKCVRTLRRLADCNLKQRSGGRLHCRDVIAAVHEHGTFHSPGFALAPCMLFNATTPGHSIAHSVVTRTATALTPSHSPHSIMHSHSARDFNCRAGMQACIREPETQALLHTIAHSVIAITWRRRNHAHNEQWHSLTRSLTRRLSQSSLGSQTHAATWC
jgi:hypothetical protein